MKNLVLSWIFSLALFIPTASVFSDTSHSETSKPIRILVLGDSLTEGYGIPPEKAYPKLMEDQLKKEQKLDIEIINAGISGSTSASAMGRLRWHLKNKPDILLLALGANDGLRGVPVAETKKNISSTLSLAKENKIDVLLAGMKLPPNYGKEYTAQFEKLFSELAKTYNTPLIPFLLDGVANHRELNLEDGIHPNEKGHQVIASHVIPYLKKMISKKSQGTH